MGEFFRYAYLFSAKDQLYLIHIEWSVKKMLAAMFWRIAVSVWLGLWITFSGNASCSQVCFNHQSRQKPKQQESNVMKAHNISYQKQVFLHLLIKVLPSWQSFFHLIYHHLHHEWLSIYLRQLHCSLCWFTWAQLFLRDVYHDPLTRLMSPNQGRL